MPSRRFPTLRLSLCILAVPVALGAWAAFAEQKFDGTIVSACEGTIGCPNKINFNTPVDTLQFQALLNVDTPLHPNEDKFTITLRNANGEILFEKLDAGLIVREGNSFVYRDDAARQSGGISRVTLRRKQAHQWRVTVIAHGDLAGASLAQMTIYLVIGNDTFLTKNVWTRRQFGWILHLPATAPTPGPTPVVTPTPLQTPTPPATPSPTASFGQTPTPSPTPKPTATPSPTPTIEPYGSVFEAFVAPPSSLLE